MMGDGVPTNPAMRAGQSSMEYLRMGQGTLELADTPVTAAAPSADDLLAQVAADEIDRLLAEAEGETPPARGAARGGEASTQQTPQPATVEENQPKQDNPVDEAALLEEMKDLKAQLFGSELAELEVQEAHPAESTEHGDAQEALEDSQGSGQSPEQTTGDTASDPDIVSVATSESAPIEEPDQEQAPTSDNPEARPAPPEASVQTEVDEPDADAAQLNEVFQQIQQKLGALEAGSTVQGGQVTIAIRGLMTAIANTAGPRVERMLEWVNWPLRNSSDAVRSLIGKIAIATFINAAIIFCYIFWARR